MPKGKKRSKMLKRTKGRSSEDDSLPDEPVYTRTRSATATLAPPAARNATRPQESVRTKNLFDDEDDDDATPRHRTVTGNAPQPHFQTENSDDDDDDDDDEEEEEGVVGASVDRRSTNAAYRERTPLPVQPPRPAGVAAKDPLIDDEDETLQTASSRPAAEKATRSPMDDALLPPQVDSPDAHVHVHAGHDAETMSPLHPVKSVSVTCADGSVLWYNTETLIDMAGQAGHKRKWVQPPDFVYAMNRELFKEIERLEDRPLPSYQHTRHVDVRHVYVCPHCYEAARVFLKKSIEDELNALSDSIVDPEPDVSQDELEARVKKHKEKERRAKWRRCPLEVMCSLNRRSELPYVAFLSAVTWRKHVKTCHGDAGEDSEGNRLRALINRHLAENNEETFERGDFDRTQSSTRPYWQADEWCNAPLYNDICWRLERDVPDDVTTRCALDLDRATELKRDWEAAAEAGVDSTDPESGDVSGDGISDEEPAPSGTSTATEDMDPHDMQRAARRAARQQAEQRAPKLHRSEAEPDENDADDEGEAIEESAEADDHSRSRLLTHHMTVGEQRKQRKLLRAYTQADNEARWLRAAEGERHASQLSCGGDTSGDDEDDSNPYSDGLGLERPMMKKTVARDVSRCGPDHILISSDSE